MSTVLWSTRFCPCFLFSYACIYLLKVRRYNFVLKEVFPDRMGAETRKHFYFSCESYKHKHGSEHTVIISKCIADAK
jgi:hypothetical protein